MEYMYMKKDEHYVDNEEFHTLLCENKKRVMEYFKPEIDKLDLSKIKKDEVGKLKRKKLINKRIMTLFKSPENRLISNQSYRRLQNQLGRIFLRICRGILTKPNFINYTWDRKDDMISEATFHMSRYVLLFDTDQDHPFSYFTTVCTRAFLQCLNKQNKYGDKFQPIEYIENMHVHDNLTIEDWG